MAAFPTSPIPPSEFLQEFLPRAFAEAQLPDEVKRVDVKLGVRLEGEGGGEWVLQIADGELRVSPQPRDEAAFTFVQSVKDWRGALWEGRGGAIGKQAAALFRPGELYAAPASALGGPPTPAAIGQLRGLDGVIRMVVRGGEEGDWKVDFKLGPGAIPQVPTTTISISAEDAAAMERGELNPMEAFMAGRIQVEGDMALMMQVQAAQMQAPSASPGSAA